MEYRILGGSGLKVSEFCLGALPMGPLQSNISAAEGGKIIRLALEHGINFIDTAQIYKTYPHIRAALNGYSGEVIINSKSTAETYEDMEAAVNEALRELGRDYIDIFLLHAARVQPDVFIKRAAAWECLQEYKRKGYIRAIGISTHSVTTVEASVLLPQVDIIFPLINYQGLGILDGNKDTMLAAITQAAQAGKGLYAMKALAGGSLLGELPQALAFVRQVPGISSVALGITSAAELLMDLKLFNGEDLSQEELASLKNHKQLFFMPFCRGCGACAAGCVNDAISMIEGRPQVDTKKCVLCGYCTPRCPEFAIRLKER
ncbi:MAG: aldo/keto reductase [Clostridiales bacterium]|nr:aldo/keto reductase [Clostridiales bacterium]